MKIVEFYRGERPNAAGYMLKDIMEFTHGAMEMDHDYIQWILPSNERSMMNSDAPTMTRDEAKVFQADPELQEAVKQSFIKFLGFLGMALVEDGPEIKIESLPSTEERPNPLWWMQNFNHNMLRITRCLKCLRLTGLQQYAIAFHNELMTWKDKFSGNTLRYWRGAVSEPLWPEDVTESLGAVPDPT